MTDHLRIAVLGAGSWGTALAAHLARNGHVVRLWGRDESQLRQMAETGENARYLPGQRLPQALRFSASLNEAVGDADAILLATPSHTFREQLQRLAAPLRAGVPLVWACKGLEVGSGKLLHELVGEEVGDVSRCAIISGPTFARELVQGLPTALTAAASTLAFADEVAGWFHGEQFRAYSSDDLIGVQVGGALKNVLAIAAGASDGLGFGANARAALITRGLAELMRLGVALGGRAETFMGLAGMGDLVLTCTDNQSRNRRMGLALARGLSIEEARAEIGQAVEGVVAAREAQRLAERHGVEMPIAEQVYAVLYQGRAPQEAVRQLLERQPRHELN
jgi:glycerol-3-phosphate dehydrogenase (NAD(P)+)